MKNKKTFAQEYIESKEKYLMYDFDARKGRRKPSVNKAIARENLLLLKDIFDNNKIKFWLMYGTLLGAEREGDFIDHDTDTDLGMFFSDINKIKEAKRELDENGFKLIRTKYPDDLITFMRKDEYIDLGLFRLEKAMFRKYWVYQENKEKFKYFEKFGTIKFLDEVFSIPHQHIKFISEHYGKNWHKPVENFPQITNNWLGYKRRIKYIIGKHHIGRKLLSFMGKRD